MVTRPWTLLQELGSKVKVASRRFQSSSLFLLLTSVMELLVPTC